MSPDDVRQMRQVAFVMSQVACAFATIEGMKALNAERAQGGNSGYSEAAFLAVPDQFGLRHNDVLTTLNGGL